MRGDPIKAMRADHKRRAISNTQKGANKIGWNEAIKKAAMIADNICNPSGGTSLAGNEIRKLMKP